MRFEAGKYQLAIGATVLVAQLSASEARQIRNLACSTPRAIVFTALELDNGLRRDPQAIRTNATFDTMRQAATVVTAPGPR